MTCMQFLNIWQLDQNSSLTHTNICGRSMWDSIYRHTSRHQTHFNILQMHGVTKAPMSLLGIFRPLNMLPLYKIQIKLKDCKFTQHQKLQLTEQNWTLKALQSLGSDPWASPLHYLQLALHLTLPKLEVKQHTELDRIRQVNSYQYGQPEKCIKNKKYWSM